MIIVDNRTGSVELAPKLRHIGAAVIEDRLDSGDFAFEGFTWKGRGAIGIERKTVSDLVACMKDARYTEGQLPRMLETYHESWLVVEGIWYEHPSDGSLTYKQGFQERLTRVPYTAVDKYLYSVARIGGVRIIQTTGIPQTCRRILDLYHHCQKPMDEHSTFQGFRTDGSVTDTIKNGNKPLTVLWAKELEGVGWVKANRFAEVFGSGHELANADVSQLAKVKGVSRKMAQDIWKRIRGR